MPNRSDKPEITEKSEKKDPILIGFFILGIIICLVLLFFPDLINKSSQKPISKNSLNLNLKKTENVRSNIKVIDKNQNTDIVLDTFQFRNYVHIQDLYDLYEFKENNLVYRSAPRTLFNTEIPINWKSKTKNLEKVYGQLSHQPDFQNIQSEFLVYGQKTEGVFKNSILGKNYFRLSQDGKIWTTTAEIHVVTLPLQSSSLPKIKTLESILYLQNEYVDFVGTIESDLNHFIVEISLDAKFTKQNTKILWLAKNDFQFRQFQLGHFYMRVRGVDSKMKITDLSDAIQVQILKPKPIPSISLSKVKHKLKDNPQEILPESQKTQLTHVDSESNLPDTAVLSDTVIQQQVQQQLRQPSTVTTSIEKIPEGPQFLNNNYLSSKLALEGSAFTMFSVDQIDQGKTNPTASSIALRWTHAQASQSYMGYIKSQAANWQSSPDGNVSTFQLEAQYRYRWVFPVNPFSKNNQSGVSIIAGYEYYKNSSQNGNSVFSPGYSVFKTGLSFEAPILSRLDTGIDFLLGQGLDSSKKYEVSGNLNYYIDTRWSLGLGYRIHLFEAGSAATASPVGLPYREGFAEGFSVLRWHY